MILGNKLKSKAEAILKSKVLFKGEDLRIEDRGKTILISWPIG